MDSDELRHAALLKNAQKMNGGKEYVTHAPWQKNVKYDTTTKIDDPEMNTVAILVMSARGDIERRNTIRDTWGKHHKNVIFMVGDSGCKVPKPNRVPYACFLKSKPNSGQQASHDAAESALSVRLQKEAAQYGDIALLPMVDSYRALPRKLKESYRWALDRTNAKWMLKIGRCMSF